MSKDSEKREIGCFCVEKDCEFFKWKIPNVSSIPHNADYFVESPSFSYEGASWVLKMYPYGQTKYETVGYIDVIIERLHSNVKKHSICCRMYCENGFKKEIIPIRGNYSFDSKWPQAKIMRFMQNLKECPEKWQIAPNDTFTLEFGFEEFRTSRNGPELQIESGKTASGKIYAASGSQEIGELIKDHSVLRHFDWKVCTEKYQDENGKIGTFPFPEDYQVQSPPFNLDSASWILKLYPYFRMKRSSKKSCDVVLQRLHSEISEHHVMLKMNFDQSYPTHDVAKGSFFINSYNTHGDVISFQLEKVEFSRLSCLHFEIEIFIKKDTRVESNPMEVVEAAAGCASISEPSIVVHQKNKVLQNFKELYLRQEDCDVIIKVKGREFPAHRLILKAQSPVFASAFRIDMKEKETGIIDIEDCDPSVFSYFLYFLYCGEVEKLSEDNVFSLFTVADKYDITDLRAMCMEFMKHNLSVNTFCDTIAFALLYDEAELIKLSTDFFARNLTDIIMTVKWQSFILENPIQGNELMIKALVPCTSQKDRDLLIQTHKDLDRQIHKDRALERQIPKDKDLERQTHKDTIDPERKRGLVSPKMDDPNSLKNCKTM